MSNKNPDVLLIGAGIMSATLGVLLKQLAPDLKVLLVERLDALAQESSDGWNNAGTGHAGYCELNYTPLQPDDTVKLDKAQMINTSYEITLQFWSYLVSTQFLPAPDQFVQPTPHLSFVWGEQNVAFLRQRYQQIRLDMPFTDIEYSDEFETLKEWMPLVMQGRDPEQLVAATRIQYGTDVDFGQLSRYLFSSLVAGDNVELLTSCQVQNLHQQNGQWQVEVKNTHTAQKINIMAPFVFIGAGGGALRLLQKSKISQSKNYAGFPVSGQFLVCKDPVITKQHHAKVYGKAQVKAPPMSVPHLDSRVINGQKVLFFGPFAGVTTKFLKKGSVFDLFASIRLTNILPILSVGLKKFVLVRYLVSEVLRSHRSRIDSLKEYYPEAKASDWRLVNAGQRVQIIKKKGFWKGELKLGTEMVYADDNSLAVLLGASPGASTAVQSMIELLERCFSKQMHSLEWQKKMQEMTPSYSLTENAELLQRVRQQTLDVLGLVKKSSELRKSRNE